MNGLKPNKALTPVAISRLFSSFVFIFSLFFFLKEKEDQGEDTVSEDKSKTKQAHFFFYSSA